MISGFRIRPLLVIADLNGQLLGPTHTCGYTPLELRLDNVSGIVFGGENVIAVYVGGTRGSGHWYEGAGIYRHVRLVKTGQLSIDRHGVFVQQQALINQKRGAMQAVRATVMLNVSVPLKNLAAATVRSASSVSVTAKLLSATGQSIVSGSAGPVQQTA